MTESRYKLHLKRLSVLLIYFCMLAFLVFPMSVGAKESAVAKGSAEAKTSSDVTDNSDGISMSISYGYGNTVKYGRYTRVTGEIHNDGKKEFVGTFQCTVPKSKDNTLYQEAILVEPGEVKKVSLYLPVIDDTGYLQIKLIDKKKDTSLEQISPLTFGNYDKTIYTGVLTAEQEEISYLDGLNLKPFYLTEETLTDNALGLDLLDVLIINDFNVSKLSNKQTAAIKTWVYQGGTLVLTADKYAEDTIKVFGKEFGISIGSSSDENITFLTQKADLKVLKQYVLDFQKSRKLFFQEIAERNQRTESTSSTGSSDNSANLSGAILNFYTLFNVKEWTDEEIAAFKTENALKNLSAIELDGGVSLVREGDKELMLSSSKRSGKVQLIAFDIGMEKEQKTMGLSVIRQIAEHISDSDKTRLDNEYYGWYMSDGLMDYIASGKDKRLPATYKYIIIIVIYLLLSGPFTYIYLRRIKKRGLGLLMVSALAVLFSMIIFMMGSETRITKPYAEYLRITDYTKGGADKIDLAFNMPNNYDYTLNLTKRFSLTEMTDINPYTNSYGLTKEVEYDNARKIIKFDNSGMKLTVTDNTAFTPIYYQGSFETEGKGNLLSDLTHLGSSVTGTVRNNYNFDIKNAILLCDGYLIDIGELKQGEEISLKNTKGYYVVSIDDLYNTSLVKSLTLLSEEGAGRNENIRLNQLITTIIQNIYLQGNFSDCLIGLKETAIEDETGEGGEILSQIASCMQTEGTEIVKLPIEVDKTAENKEFVYSIDSYIRLEGSRTAGYYSSRYMTNDSLIQSYRFPAGESIIDFTILKSQNEKGISKYTQNFNGTVYFLNINTGDYDEVFTGNYDAKINAALYLTKDNTLTVRYLQESSIQDYQAVLPCISYWKEASADAHN